MMKKDRRENSEKNTWGIPAFMHYWSCGQCAALNKEHFVCIKCAEKEHAENLARGDDPSIYRVKGGMGFHNRWDHCVLRETGMLCQPAFVKKRCFFHALNCCVRMPVLDAVR